MGNSRYLDIARELIQRIDRGVYDAGEPLPPRLELAREFNVARATIDRCIEHLVTAGFLSPRHGSGTYVNEIPSRNYNVAVIGRHDVRIPRLSGYRWHYYDYDELLEKSSRDKLLKYDGLIWYRPEGDALQEDICKMDGRIPQVVVNRTYPGVHCVSTDHRGAYYEITMERLKANPDSIPFFLKLDKMSAVLRYRESGFFDACRELGRFYEILYLSCDYNEALETLRRREWDRKQPLVLISDSLSNTGAVMRWIWEARLTPGRDVFYSDFDNDFPTYVFGLRVTSYLQDDELLISTAVEQLAGLIGGSLEKHEHLLMFPRRIVGDT